MSKIFNTLLFITLITSLLSSCASRKTDNSEDFANEQVEELYQRAKRAMNNGNYFIALDYYRALEANFPYGQVTEQAKLDMIYALDKTNQVEEAVEAADNFIQLYPTHSNVDYAYYMKGVASFEKKSSRLDSFIKGGKSEVRDPKPLRDSQEAFRELIQRFPDSKYSADAEHRIVYLRNRLAERELEVAKHYYNSRTFVAAVNRCKNIIYQYETSPAVEGALLLMEQAYREMGLLKLAASTRQVLEVNFPEYKDTDTSRANKQRGLFGRLFGSNSDNHSEFEMPEFSGETRISEDQANEKPSLFKRIFGWWGNDEAPSLD